MLSFRSTQGAVLWSVLMGPTGVTPVHAEFLYSIDKGNDRLVKLVVVHSGRNYALEVGSATIRAPRGAVGG